MKAKQTIYIVDDEAIIRASTESLLRARGDLDTREFTSGGAFLDALDGLEPGCVILDLQMDGASGAVVMERLASRKRDFRAIVVTGTGDLGAAVRAFRSGAVDFFYKPYETKPLMDAIDRGLYLLDRGGYPADVLEHARATMARLTAAELDLLHRLIDGQSHREIARSAGGNERAVQMMRARLLDSLGASSLLAAVRTAAIAGLFEN